MTIGVLAVQGAFIESEKLLLPDILWQQELFFSPIILLQMLLFFFTAVPYSKDLHILHLL